MARSERQKTKILELAKIFIKETDEKHGLTMHDLLDRLEQRGIPAERKSVYRDIEALRDFGLDIQKKHGGKTGGGVSYHLKSRMFDISELLFIRDAVQSCRFLTERQSEEIVGKIGKLAPCSYLDEFSGNVFVDKRVANANDVVLENVNKIKSALVKRLRITFKYITINTDAKRQLRHKGKVYEQTPVTLIYSNDLYYLVTFDSQDDDFRTFRVDRMAEVSTTGTLSSRNARIANFDAARFQERSFGMFDGEERLVHFKVRRKAIDSMVDRFGIESIVKKLDKDTVLIRANVVISPVFYGWLAQFGDNVVIDEPEEVKIRYSSYLKKIFNIYSE